MAWLEGVCDGLRETLFGLARERAAGIIVMLKQAEWEICCLFENWRSSTEFLRR